MIKTRLKALLADREMLQRELSEKTGIRLPTIVNISTGKIKELPLSALDKICEVLNCQPGDLLEYRRDAAENVEE